ncbi:hypothetical protein LRP31_18780 [Mesorhizobium mediterraneum]|uniref:Uncharacterized protein n=1 Tax=Mesorhizobium mediterraneum TaxID=43617 RepID=A0AB36RAT7_9HYPH|nr:hypothetical protein [Mesorhizobium mediterraneum]PAQ01564.1 hypothetical protein CIT25_16135 [Mesorhizobium mediterraneum]WIW51139.1 hypothetical protein LRP31_18780 [Mesorhizobium mediterraneum]
MLNKMMSMNQKATRNGLYGRPPATTKTVPVKLTSVRPQPKPVRVVRLYDEKRKANELFWIRKLERAGLTEGNSQVVKLMKDNYRRRYGERV